jgi:hypothetical protein
VCRNKPSARCRRACGYTPLSDLDVFPNDGKLLEFSRHVACDESGKFRLEHVANGEYYIFSKVVWSAQRARYGGDLMESIEVRNGDTKAISLVKDLSTQAL